MKLSTMRGVILALLFCGGLINYMDRAVFAVLAPQIAHDLQLDAVQIGLTFSFFSFGYIAFCFVGGWAADRFGAKRTLVVSMTLWSIFCALTGAAFSLVSLLVVRTLFGIGESPWIASANKVLVNWFPKERYTSAFGIASAGQPLGGVVAGPLVGMLAVSIGWRGSLVLVAGFGLLWVLCWVYLASDHPSASRWLASAEATLAQKQMQSTGQAQEAGTAQPSLWKVLAQPTVVAVTICFFAYTYMLYFFLSWFPSYLTQAFSMKLSDMSWASAVPWLLGVIGLVAGGFICDYAVKKIGNSLLARKIILVPGLLIAAFAVVQAGTTTSAVVAVVYMAIGVGFMYLTGPTYFAIAMESVRVESMGTVGGFMVLVANIGGMLAPLITGYLVRESGNFTSAFYVAGALVSTGALIVTVFARSRPESRTAHYSEA